MRQSISDLMGNVPVEYVDELLGKEENVRKVAEKGMKSENCRSRWLLTIPRWAVAAVILLVCVSIGGMGYAALGSFQAIRQYGNPNSGTTTEEQLTSEWFMAENEDYLVRAEAVLVDQEKTLLVSVQAKGVEAWKKMTENSICPQFIGESLKGGYFQPVDNLSAEGELVTENGEENDNNRWKKYFSWTLEPDVNTGRILFDQSGTAYFQDVEQTNQAELTMTIPLTTELKKGIIIYPGKIRVSAEEDSGERRLVQIEIGEDGIWFQEIGDEGVITKERFPEIIAVMKDGKTICLYLDNREQISMKVDEMMRSDWLESGKTGSSSEDGRIVETGRKIQFVNALEIEEVEAVLVDGQRYDLH